MAWEIRKVTEAPQSKGKAKKDKPYLHWLHALPCSVTGRYGVEAAHVSFANPWYGHHGRGKGTKAADLFAVPLSPASHREQHSGGEETYWLQQGIDPHQLAVTLFAIYSAYPEPLSTEKATARIQQGIALARSKRGED